MKRSKYGAVSQTIDGIPFDSTKEARRYMDLRLLERAKEISDLECQPKFYLHVIELWRKDRIAAVTCGYYAADFRYTDRRSGEIVVEDVKGVRTAVYKLKRKLVEAIHGVTIREVS